MCLYCIGTSIGKRYARTDELGVPFAVTVDSTSSVTIRERDSKDQIRVSIDEVAAVVKEVSEGRATWADILKKYPAHTSLSVKEVFWQFFSFFKSFGTFRNFFTL